MKKFICLSVCYCAFALAAQVPKPLQIQFASLQKQLATTKDNLTKIGLNLQILNLQNQIDPNSMLTNATTTLNTIKALIPTPVPANLQWFSNGVDLALELISQMTPQSGQQPELWDILNHLLSSSNMLR